MTESQTESLFAAVGGEGDQYVLPVAVRNRIAVYCSREKLILGNSDYRLRFDFDGEWDLYPTKTVRLRFVDERGQFIIHNILLEGEECTVPVLPLTETLFVGVFAGDIRTSTEAEIPCWPSALSYEGAPLPHEEDVYVAIMKKLDALASDCAEAVRFTPMLRSEEEKGTARANLDGANGITLRAEGECITVTNAAPQPFGALSVYGKSEAVGETVPSSDPPAAIRSVGQEGSLPLSVGGEILRIPVENGLCGIPVSTSAGNTEGNYTDGDGQAWVSDEVDPVRGVLIRRIGRLVLDGDTPVASLGMPNTYGFSTDAVGAPAAKGEGNCLCSLFKGSPTGAVYGSDDHSVSVSDGMVWICSSHYSAGGAEAMKAHFASLADAGTPAVLFYVLDEPVEIPLAAEVTDTFRKLSFGEGERVITADEGAWLSAAYTADTKKYVDARTPSRDPVVLADVTTTEQTNALVIPLGDDVRNYSRLLITLTMKHYQAASSPGIYLWDTVEGYQHGRLTDFKGLFNETSATTVYFDATFFANTLVVQASKKVSSISASDGVVSLVSNLSTSFSNAELIDAIRISSMYMDTGAKIKVEGVPK